MDRVLSAILDDEEVLETRRVEQIVAICGNGTLSDGSECSGQFRSFLKNVSSRILKKYTDECLDGSTPRNNNSGLILQDVVNEIGDRLAFRVEPGSYRGAPSRIGNDGLWISPTVSFVIEVKTSDLSVRLDKIAGYRDSLIHMGQIEEEHSSVLIVLGRQDTGDLEAQIRGSKFAWDIRLIGIDALLRLMEIKENLSDPNTIYQIAEVLKPIEYTRVDKIVDIVFSTSWDISSPGEIAAPDEGTMAEVIAPQSNTLAESETRTHASPVKFYEKCIARINQRLGKHFIRSGRVTYSSSDKSTNVVLLNSKAWHTLTRRGNTTGTASGQIRIRSCRGQERSFVAFGCETESKVLLIPFDRFRQYLPELGTTTDESGELSHSHVVIVESGEGFAIRVGDRFEDISEFVL